MKHDFNGKTRIPNYENYWMDPFGQFYAKQQTTNALYLRKLTIYNRMIPEIAYIMVRIEGKTSRVFVKNLFELTFPTKENPYIKRLYSGEDSDSRKMTRDRFISWMLSEYPSIHISMTRNRDNVYETSEDLRSMGIICCENCGLPQPSEIRKCGECNQWILKG